MGNLKKVEPSIPEIIESPILMDGANANINIYTGKFTLKSGSIQAEVDGTIEFVWFPETGAKFFGQLLTSTKDFYHQYSDNNSFDLVVDNIAVGKCYINSYSTNFLKTDLNGILSARAVFGDKSVPVEKIRFAVPNLRSFYGSVAKKMEIQKRGQQIVD